MPTIHDRVEPGKEQTTASTGSRVFATADYVTWYRTLFELMRADAGATMLSDSTIVEPSDLLRRHSRQALEQDYAARFRSTFGWGSPLLISAIARRYGVDEKSILTTTGCTTAISFVYSAYLSPGDHVLIETPHFELLPRLAEERGASIGFVQREPVTYAIDPERLEAQIQSNTRLLVLTNAHNPSGAFLNDAALLEIARVANRHGIAVPVDEVYGDFVPASVRRGPAAALDPCFISINSLTKVYGLHALKCGWIIAAEAQLAKIRPVYSRLETSTSKIAHGIASLVFEELPGYEAHWRQVLDLNRPLLLQTSQQLREEGLIEGAVEPYGCMYFPRLARVSDTRRFAAWMWDRAKLGIAPGEFYGAPGHIRIGCGQTPREFRAGLETFVDGLRAYGNAAHETRARVDNDA